MKHALLTLALFASCRSAEPMPHEGPLPSQVQSDPPIEPSPRPKKVRPSFILQPGDTIDIRVYKHSDLDLTIRIPEEGSINYPLLGAVVVAGKKPAELQAEIREKLAKDYLRDPQVSLTVKEYKPRKVYVLGGVRSPGGYPLSPTEHMSLLQLVSSAGGFVDKSSSANIQILRRTETAEREVIRLSLPEIEKALAGGNADADPDLWPDDLIVMPNSTRAVYVMGAVTSPGSFEIPADTSLKVSMVISRAGGFTKFAASGKVTVLRQGSGGGSKKISVDVDEVLNGKLELDVELKPGDIIWVPERGFF